MIQHAEIGPLCESCAMPMDRPQDFGTDAEGKPVAEYCTFCYRNGAFVEPRLTLDGMIRKAAGAMAQRGVMAEAGARTFLASVLPEMKRWNACGCTSTSGACCLTVPIEQQV